MTEVTLNLRYIRNPFKSIVLLVLAAFTFEAFQWLFAFQKKIDIVDQYGGGLTYLWVIIRGMILPEISTLVILLTLINIFHIVCRIKKINLRPGKILTYQAKILPVMLLAFFLFNPITQTIRYLLVSFPSYNLNHYMVDYIEGTYTARMYCLYLIPVLIIGYGSANGSLLVDVLEQRRQRKRGSDSIQTIQAIQALAPVPTEGTYLTHLKAKNNHGETILAVNECYWFETEERYYYAVHRTGRYAITKTMNELENELNPELFFRTKRNCIINLSFVASYSYWENGKYIIRMQTPNNDEADMPRARLQDFKSRLVRFSIQEIDFTSQAQASTDS